MRQRQVVVMKVNKSRSRLLNGSRTVILAAFFAYCFLQLEQSIALAVIDAPGSNLKFGGGGDVVSEDLLTDRLFIFSIMVLVFGIAALLSLILLLRGAGDTKEEVIRIYTIVLIIIGTMLLISGGFTGYYIAPALGLFGTIVGYLLGRSDRLTPTSRKSGGETSHD